MLDRVLIAAAILAISPAVLAQSPSYFCTGATDLMTCPCANPGANDTGCDNAQSTGGVKLDFISGTFNTVNSTIDLIGTGFNPNAAVPVILVRSDTLMSPIVFGDGLRCLVSPTVRLPAYWSEALNGTWPDPNASWPVGVPTLSQPSQAGSTRHYQLFYRNTPSTFCTSDDLNTSSGLSIPW